MNLLRSHLPPFSEAFACGMFREMESIMEMVCSQAAMVLPFRGVGHDDALGGGRGHVDVVDADAGAADDLEVLAGLDDLPGHLGLAADDECVIVLDLLDELLLRELGLHVDLHAGL